MSGMIYHLTKNGLTKKGFHGRNTQDCLLIKLEDFHLPDATYFLQQTQEISTKIEKLTFCEGSLGLLFLNYFFGYPYTFRNVKELSFVNIDFIQPYLRKSSSGILPGDLKVTMIDCTDIDFFAWVFENRGWKVFEMICS